MMRIPLMRDKKHYRPMGFSLEKQTSKFPADAFLWLATGSILGSLALRLMNRRQDSLFVGEWAPTFMILGLYTKLIKKIGSD